MERNTSFAPSELVGALEEESLKPQDRDWRAGIATAIGAALLLAGIVFPIVWLSPLASDRDGPSAIASAASPSAGASEASPSGEDVSPPPGGPPFHPETDPEGDMTVMPVTFSDGSTAELVYPSTLAVEKASAYPADPYVEGGPRSCGPNVIASRSNLEGHLYDGERPLRVFTAANGDTVGLWPPVHSGDPYTYLVVPIDSWVLVVYCYPEERYSAPGRSGPPMLPPFQEDEVALWASSMDGHETRDGFLTLMPREPLHLADWRYNVGPAIRFSYPDDRLFDMTLEACDPNGDWDRSGNGEVIEWCVEPGIRIYGNGDEAFLDALVAGLEIRNFRRGSG